MKKSRPVYITATILIALVTALAFLVVYISHRSPNSPSEPNDPSTPGTIKPGTSQSEHEDGFYDGVVDGDRDNYDDEDDISDLPGEAAGTIERFMAVTSERSETLYLKNRTFCKYNGKRSWSAPNPYDRLINETYSYDYLTSFKLDNLGISSHRVKLEYDISGRFLPYYLIAEQASAQTNDTQSELQSDEVTVNILGYKFTGSIFGELPEELLSGEIAYRQFVHSQYLDVNGEISKFLSGESGLKIDKNDENLLMKVVSYLGNNYTPNDMVDYSLGENEDMILEFLRKYKEGNDSVFASAATLILRYLGVPARYVVGLKADVLSGKRQELSSSNAYAWTEIYCDGTGWVMFDFYEAVLKMHKAFQPVGDEELPPEKFDGVIMTSNESKVYDGTPLVGGYCIRPIGSDYEESVTDALRAGDFVKFASLSSISDVGEAENNVVMLVICDKDGSDVTDTYNFAYSKGILKMTPAKLTLTATSAEKDYDGNPLISNAFLMDGARYSCLSRHLLYTGDYLQVMISGTLTERGTCDNIITAVKITNAHGSDKTKNYIIETENGTLKVN